MSDWHNYLIGQRGLKLQMIEDLSARRCVISVRIDGGDLREVNDEQIAKASEDVEEIERILTAAEVAF